MNKVFYTLTGKRFSLQEMVFDAIEHKGRIYSHGSGDNHYLVVFTEECKLPLDANEDVLSYEKYRFVLSFGNGFVGNLVYRASCLQEIKDLIVDNV